MIEIVRVSVDGHAPFPTLVAEINPTTQFLRATYNNFVSNLCDRLDTLAIAKPPNVSPGSCEGLPRKCLENQLQINSTPTRFRHTLVNSVTFMDVVP